MSVERKPEQISALPDFETEAARIEHLIGVSDLLMSDVKEKAEKYGLEEREVIFLLLNSHSLE